MVEILVFAVYMHFRNVKCIFPILKYFELFSVLFPFKIAVIQLLN